jgi:hypothetical protein
MKWNEEDRSLHGVVWLGIFKQAASELMSKTKDAARLRVDRSLRSGAPEESEHN